MLWACSDIAKFTEFRDVFRALHPNIEFIDLSKIESDTIYEQADSIRSHHTNACVFLGYLEPGWMLNLQHQTLMREVFRKFDVGFVYGVKESIPFSWKNEIEVLYG